MNYIKRLESERKVCAAELAGLKSGLQDLQSYLMSTKFYVDPTVQAQDVLNRLQAALDFGTQLAAEQETVL